MMIVEFLGGPRDGDVKEVYSSDQIIEVRLDPHAREVGRDADGDVKVPMGRYIRVLRKAMKGRIPYLWSGEV